MITTTIIDGKKIRSEILVKIKEEVTLLPFQPIFCDVLVGEDPVSRQYVQMKGKMAESVGIHFHNADFSSSISTAELIEEIKKLNKIPNMCGIIVQLPLPPSLDKRAILDAIDSHLDVDCLGTLASKEFYEACLRRQGKIEIGFPTALSCMALLDSTLVNLVNKKILVIGQGELVGKPVSALLKFRGLQSDFLVRNSENKEESIKNADVIISGTGKGQNIKGDMIKEGAIIIDAGTSESNGGIVGDVDSLSVKGVASFLSPVPGGVGPVTVAMLLNNVLNVAKKLNK